MIRRTIKKIKKDNKKLKRKIIYRSRKPFLTINYGPISANSSKTEKQEYQLLEENYFKIIDEMIRYTQKIRKSKKTKHIEKPKIIGESFENKFLKRIVKLKFKRKSLTRSARRNKEKFVINVLNM